MREMILLSCLLAVACSTQPGPIPQPDVVAEPEPFIEPWAQMSIDRQKEAEAALAELGLDAAYSEVLKRLRSDIDPDAFAASPLPAHMAAEHLYRHHAAQMAAIGMTGDIYDALSAAGYDMGRAVRNYGGMMRWEDKLIFSERVEIIGTDGRLYVLRGDALSVPDRAPPTGCVHYRSPTYRNYQAAIYGPGSPDLLTPDCIGARPFFGPQALTVMSEGPPSLQDVLEETARIRAALEANGVFYNSMPSSDPLQGDWKMMDLRMPDYRRDNRVPVFDLTVTGATMLTRSGCVAFQHSIERVGASTQFRSEMLRDAEGEPMPICARGLTREEGAWLSALEQVDSVRIETDGNGDVAILSGPDVRVELRR